MRYFLEKLYPVASILLAFSQLARASEHIFEVGSLDVLESKIIQSGKLVIVDFYSDNCQPCQFLMPVLEETVNSYQGKVILAKVNVAAHMDISNHYGVQKIPTLLIFHKGELQERYINPDPSSASIKKIVDSWIQAGSATQ